jgi:hypothetical protein
MPTSSHIQTVLTILQDEIDGNVAAAMRKMTSSYTQTWMYQGGNDVLFPSVRKPSAEQMQEVYETEGREYHIYNITESVDTVMVECVEQYPNVQTGFLHRTPLVLIVQFDGDMIVRGRHYCDPRLSQTILTDEVLKAAYDATEPKMVLRTQDKSNTCTQR